MCSLFYKICDTLEDEQVSMLTHTYLNNPVRTIKVTTYNDQAGSPPYV